MFLLRFVCLCGFLLLCVNLFSFMWCVKTLFFPSKLYEILGNLTEEAHALELLPYMYISQLFKIRFIKSTNLVAFITMVLFY
jgi:hypothetical protein